MISDGFKGSIYSSMKTETQEIKLFHETIKQLNTSKQECTVKADYWNI